MDTIFEVIADIALDIITIPLERWDKLRTWHRVIIISILIFILCVGIYMAYGR